MEKYNNEEYLKRSIMEQSRHLFIYGKKCEYRHSFFKKLDDDYPLLMDSSAPTSLYFESFGIPKIDCNLSNKDTYTMQSLSRDYLSFLIASKIVEKSIYIDETILNSKLSTLINILNMSKNKGYQNIKTFTDLLKEIKDSRDFYYESYVKYVKNLSQDINRNDIVLPYLDILMFVKLYKKAINKHSHFGIIFDKSVELETFSIQAINSLISSRINEDISIKVALELDAWETYYDVNGLLIEEPHDYGTIELDSEHDEFIKNLKRDFNN